MKGCFLCSQNSLVCLWFFVYSRSIFLERIKVLSKCIKKIFNIISHHGHKHQNHKKTAGVTWYTEGRRERVRNSQSVLRHIGRSRSGRLCEALSQGSRQRNPRSTKETNDLRLYHSSQNSYYKRK